MSNEQITILILGMATVLLFLWGRWRHDMVALMSLLSCVFAGLVPPADAFGGFAHPAVITVACVLVLSRGLQDTGVVDALARFALPSSSGLTLTLASLMGLGAILSAFINNVGAMALLMPVGIQIAGRFEVSPGRVLMPLAFSTILGGMTTLIGTPPNMIVSGFRAGMGADDFGMFDFTPVGLTVAGIGVAFVTLIGWRLVPKREPAGAATFDTGTYLTETRVTENSSVVGKTLREVERELEDVDAQIVGMVRNQFRVLAPNPARVVRTGDILVIEAEPESLAPALNNLGLSLENNVPAKETDGEKDVVTPERPKKADEAEHKDRVPDEVVLRELVAMSDSRLVGRTPNEARIGIRNNLTLLALSRSGRRAVGRLRSTRIQTGDVLLMQGPEEVIAEFANESGCLPLAVRQIHVPDKGRSFAAMAVMFAAVTVAVFGLMPAAIAFSTAVLLYLVRGVVSPRKVYEAVDWPVIVMLGALIPVAAAMESTGAADLIAKALVGGFAFGNPVVSLALLLVVTMTLSDFMNNAATAAVMCPIAIGTADQLGSNPDAFLMAVAIGASCAFLTPIGHQNNTLILGPGGFRFGDYWRLGLPMEILVVLVSIPTLLVVWPL